MPGSRCPARQFSRERKGTDVEKKSDRKREVNKTIKPARRKHLNKREKTNPVVDFFIDVHGGKADVKH